MAQAAAPKTDDGWNVVKTDEGNDDATLVRFTEIGDEFIAQYSGKSDVTRSDGSKMRQDRFGKDNEKYFINTPHDLKAKLDKVPYGNLVKIVYTEDRNTGQPSPMKLFTVAHKRP